MATVGIKVFKHHKKTDGTYNVKIRVTHKGTNHFLDTIHFVCDKQLTGKYTVKDNIIVRLLNLTLDDYRETISKLSGKLHLFTSETLRDYLRDKDQEVDFLKFCQTHIDEMTSEGRGSSAKTLNTVRLSLIDYFNSASILPSEINNQMLAKYEKYLRSERQIERMNQGKPHKRKIKGMNDAAVHNHFRDLRILFKAAMTFYNNPQLDDIKIPHCPFDTYKIVNAPATKKRNLSVAHILQIKDCIVEPGGRAELAKDLFMLSFYLCGMNAVDLYHLNKDNIRKGRLEYNRTKTKSRRKDNAFISIKLVAEAKPLLEKFLGKLNPRYNSSQNLDRELNEGMKLICKFLKIPVVTFYWARHSFGTLARNKCRMSIDDVAQALNHIDSEHKTTDIYIEKDWKIVDDVQHAVISLLKGTFAPELKKGINAIAPIIKTNKILPSIVLTSLLA